VKQALKQLLDRLDGIFEEHEELGDTAVRQFMYEAVHRSFIDPQPGYELPDDFGMFSEEGNGEVRAALKTFLAHPEVAATATQLTTPKERLDAFQDSGVESAEGNFYDEYFGYSEAP
jgi:hypothetical protein